MTDALTALSSFFTLVLPMLFFTLLFRRSIDYVHFCVLEAQYTRMTLKLFFNNILDILKTSHSTHHAKNFGFANFFITKTLHITIF
jgi:hypothetical protein